MLTRCCVAVVLIAAAASAGSRKTASVSARALRRHVRATGTVQPVEAVQIQVPEIVDAGGNLVLTRIVPSGTVVKAGDVVAEFDRTRLLDAARDAKARFEDLSHQVEQKMAQQRSDREKRASELQQADADLAKAKLDLRKGPLLSDIDRLKAETRLETAQAHVTTLKKTAALRERSESADLKILELQRNRQRMAMERAQANAERLQMRAPISGMASPSPVWRRDSMGVPQEGDQLWSGQTLLRIFSATDMEIQVTMAEPDGAALKPGARATVHLDAYPNLVFNAAFVSAAPVASGLLGAETLKFFNARFRLEGRDPHLLPDLSAALDIEVASEKPVLAVPRAAVLFRRGRPYVLRVEPEGKEKDVEVSLGAFDDNHSEVLSGLREGDRVVLAR